MKTTQPIQGPPRERIIRAVDSLFYEEGIRVGVEAIAAAAGTTKMAIYRIFGSKDALVEQWVLGLTERYAAVLDALEQHHPDDPRAQLEGIIDFTVAGLYAVSHRGCPFVNAIAELPDRRHPARRLIEVHKARQAQRIERLCERLGIPEPTLAAAEITYLLEDAQITALNRGVPATDDCVALLVRRILDRAKALSKRKGAGRVRRVQPPRISLGAGRA
jgi:AcrR family transcriptional regulator